ncbi:hypothetical protein C7212DRAFT_343054 [Tuber magnatum]|uniref:Uncharacterized protein n=1 Tax=Tuber magnatum TaxID=42249 RepID=A0A317SRV5_9PEZI|nr:hypothetical protein C7212DRAFT_343054 [Tuber magnatum]
MPCITSIYHPPLLSIIYRYPSSPPATHSLHSQAHLTIPGKKEQDWIYLVHKGPTLTWSHSWATTSIPAVPAGRSPSQELPRIDEKVDGLYWDHAARATWGWWSFFVLAILSGALVRVGWREHKIGQLQNELAFSRGANEGLKERPLGLSEPVWQWQQELCYHNTSNEEPDVETSDAEQVGWVDATMGQHQPEPGEQDTGHQEGDTDGSTRRAERSSPVMMCLVWVCVHSGERMTCVFPIYNTAT